MKLLRFIDLSKANLIHKVKMLRKRMTRVEQMTDMSMQSFEILIVNEINNAYDKNQNTIINTEQVPVKAQTREVWVSQRSPPFTTGVIDPIF